MVKTVTERGFFFAMLVASLLCKNWQAFAFNGASRFNTRAGTVSKISKVINVRSALFMSTADNDVSPTKPAKPEKIKKEKKGKNLIRM
jgi:hypothetical protein